MEPETPKLLKYVHSLVYNQSIFKLMAQNEWLFKPTAKTVRIYEYQLLVLPTYRFTPIKTEWFYQNQDKSKLKLNEYIKWCLVV